jgi:hypothetical protein
MTTAVPKMEMPSSTQVTHSAPNSKSCRNFCVNMALPPPRGRG